MFSNVYHQGVYLYLISMQSSFSIKYSIVNKLTWESFLLIGLLIIIYAWKILCYDFEVI